MANRKKVLAVASAGGHFTQLLRLTPAFEGTDLTIATALEDLRSEAEAAAAAAGMEAPRFKLIVEANRWQKLRLIRSLAGMAALVLRLRPDVVVSTGAAPGLLALLIGKMIGARTIWIDSIANASELSMSGRKARRIADVWLTQWEHLATPNGPSYRGSVL